jgi:hypothetical protein
VRRLLTVLLPALVLVVLADPASAKGPSEATLTGPGIDEPIDLRDAVGDETFWAMSGDLGAYAAMGGTGLIGSRAEVGRPIGELGPAYELTWGGFVEHDVTVVLHPYAEGGGRLFVPGGQDTITGYPTEEGWFVLPRRVVPALHEAGLPRAPAEPVAVASRVADEPGGSWPVADVAAGAAVAAGLAGAVLLLRRGRRRDLVPA